VAPIVNFSKNAERPELSRPVKGPGPSDHQTKLRGPVGGTFRSKTGDPKQSALRFVDIVIRDAMKPPPGPGAHCLPRDLDKPSPRACTAPFKSTVPTSGFPKKLFGPGPQTYFRSDMKISDLECPLWPYGYIPNSFKQECWWRDPALRRMMWMPTARAYELLLSSYGWNPAHGKDRSPPPNAYTLPGIAEDFWYGMWKHRPTVCNPKLGFMTSADARGKEVTEYQLNALRGVCDEETIPDKWRNIRPKKCQTYPYHECGEECRAEVSTLES